MFVDINYIFCIRKVKYVKKLTETAPMLSLFFSPFLEGLKIKKTVLFKYKLRFPCQSLKIFIFRVKLSDSMFFLLGHSTIVKLI